MAIYSISDLEKMSGVKAHTIRIWEKRYKVLNPRRTATNIRYYLEQDLKKLLNIALLNRNGYKISKIARMSSHEIRDAVLDLSTRAESEEDVLADALTIAMLDLDEFKFNKVLQENIDRIGFKRTIFEVVFPFLNRLGVLWMTGSISPVQENYVAHLIKQKIFVALENLSIPEGRPTFMIYLPEGERQELSLLFVNYLFREQGFRVINLGQGVSIAELREAYDIVSPSYIFTMINESTAPLSINEYLEELSTHFEKSTILLTGLQLARRRLRSRDNYRILDSIEDITTFLDRQQLG